MASDYQKNQVYQAENLVTFFFSDSIRRDDDLDYWRAYVKSLLHKDWFQDRYNLKNVHIFASNNEDENKVASSLKRGERGTIFLSDNGRNELTVLHEISHLISNEKQDHHGSEYVENILFLISNQMGYWMESRLTQAYIFYNVNWPNKSEYADSDNPIKHYNNCQIENSLQWQSAKKMLEPVMEYFDHFEYNSENQENLKEFELYMTLHEILDPVYCPVCGSCGEDLCCDPTVCKAVQDEYEGLYCEGNLKSYGEILQENYQLEEENKRLKGLIENAKNG